MGRRGGEGEEGTRDWKRGEEEIRGGGEEMSRG